MTPDQAITIVRTRLSRSMRSAVQGLDLIEVLMDEVLRLRSALATERERCARIAEDTSPWSCRMHSMEAAWWRLAGDHIAEEIRKDTP